MADATDTVLEVLRELVHSNFGVAGERLQIDATLRDVGIDSFQFIELVFLAEERFGVSVDLNALELRTVRDVVSALAQLIAAKESTEGSFSLEK